MLGLLGWLFCGLLGTYLLNEGGLLHARMKDASVEDTFGPEEFFAYMFMILFGYNTLAFALFVGFVVGIEDGYVPVNFDN